MRRALGWTAIIVIVVALATTRYVWWKPGRSPRHSSISALSEPPPGPNEGRGEVGPSSPPHPLLGDAKALVLEEPDNTARSTTRSDLAEIAHTAIRTASQAALPASLTIDYPLDATIFPPEIVPPTFLWHEPTDRADTWLIQVTWNGQDEGILVVSAGSPPPAGEIDARCISKNNEIYQPTPYQASARSWTPDDDVWAAIRLRSTASPARLVILGLPSGSPGQVVSRGEISFTTSQDPVGAPIFYRDVPLAPAVTRKGVIAPLDEDAIALIGWRLRDVSRHDSRLLVDNIPTCTNCHSFSADGNTLGMDLDGPTGDKGSYVLAPVTRETVIENPDVISWNSFPGKPQGHKTIGFLSRVSPDGQYSVTTLNEELFVANFVDYKFLQVFYPTRGILGYYARSSGEIRALPGADDPEFVHCDPVWTPDGKNLVFARAQARRAYPEDGVMPERANDPAETPIQYDLYRMPFNAGQGGRPEPIAGASNNGMSNTFPKVSPDGKWIVFVQCRNAQLMRPDGTLWIVPAEGGTARKMRCNTPLMNSWHSFSPNGRWMVFSSKANTPYTQMFLTHIDDDGTDSPPVLIPNSTAANRAVNLPEFVNRPYDELVSIRVRALEHLQHDLRGEQLAMAGKLDEALAEFESAIELQPDFWQAYVKSAGVLLDQGKPEEAKVLFEKVLSEYPDLVPVHVSVGAVLARRGRFDEAASHFQRAIQLDPNSTDAHSNLGKLYQIQGQLGEATAHFFRAMDIDQLNPVAHFELAGVLLQRQMVDLAIEHLQKAVQLDPQLLDAHLALAKALASQGNYAAAVARFNDAAAVDPNNFRPVNDLAWLLAVCPDDQVRDGARAVQLAERACRATRHSNPVLLGTLAAAYAEVGRFPEAADTATKALEQVVPQDKLLAEGLRRQLQLYRSGKPCRDSHGAPD